MPLVLLVYTYMIYDHIYAVSYFPSELAPPFV